MCNAAETHPLLAASAASPTNRVSIRARILLSTRELMATFIAGSDMVVLLCLFWSLVEVHSQTAPYLTFNDSMIPNHAYVNLSLMMYPGNDDANDTSSTVICHTDLTTCCRGGGSNLANWSFPDGNVLPGAGSDNVNQVPITQRKRDQVVRLQRGPIGAIGDIQDGIYRCDIATMAVNDNTARETVYVGVYGSGGILKMIHDTCINTELAV